MYLKNNVASVVTCALTIGMTAIVATGCSSSDDVKSDKTYEAIKFTNAEINAIQMAEPFAFSLFKECIESAETCSNVVMSPLSAQLSLSMVANGATGETLDEILHALGCSSSGLDAMNAYAQRLTSGLEAAAPSGST